MVDRLVIRPGAEGRLNDSLETAFAFGGGLVKVDVVGKEELLFSQNYACPDCGVSLEELTPRMFSFNNPFGACPTCSGTGIVRERLPHLFDGIGFLPEKNSVGGRSQMGIGLSVCMSIVKAHGGSMSARNTDGGTVVSFSLPVPPVSETAAE